MSDFVRQMSARDFVHPRRGVSGARNNTVAVRDRPEATLARLQRVVTSATVIESDRGEAAPLIDGILQLVRDQASSTGERERATECCDLLDPH